MRGLEKITVLDFSKLLPGPYCTMLLADLGCRVIRVELPYWPDMLRGIKPDIEGQGFVYSLANRNKESLALDFRKPEGFAALMKLVARADVLVEGFRPGLMERIGLGAKALCRRFPKLVYCSISGFGQQGPMSRRAGHDINFLAESGFTGAGDSNRAFSFPSTQVADLCGSHTAAVAIMGALLDRASSGRGRHIDISMSEAISSWLLLPMGHELASGKPYDKDAEHWWSGGKAFYRHYRTKDGRSLCVAALERPFAEALLRELGREDLIAKIPSADESHTSLIRELQKIFRGKTLAQWEAQLCVKDACVTPVRSVSEAMTRFRQPPGPGVEPLISGRRIRSPIRLSREDYRLRRKAPRMGQDNLRVLRSFGLSRSEIRRLVDRKCLMPGL